MVKYVFELEERFVEGMHFLCWGGEPEALLIVGVHKGLDVVVFFAVFVFEECK